MLVHLRMSLQKLRPDAQQVIVKVSVVDDQGRQVEGGTEYVGVDSLVARVEPIVGRALQTAVRTLAKGE